MRFLNGAAVAIALLGSGQAASAQTISLREPEMIAELLRVEGYEASVDPAKADADPVLTGKKDGLTFGVYFSNCDKGKECQSVELYGGFENHKFDAAKINEWNRDRRFARAYLDKEGHAVLSMDVNVEPGGLERKLFVDYLEIWWSLFDQFEREAYPPDPAKAPKSAK